MEHQVVMSRTFVIVGTMAKRTVFSPYPLSIDDASLGLDTMYNVRLFHVHVGSHQNPVAPCGAVYYVQHGCSLRGKPVKSF
jgi:hypothetical protein